MTTQGIDFAGALRLFVLGAQNKIDEHYYKNLSNLTLKRLTVEVGRRYVKIVVIDGYGSRFESRSAHSFVDKTNGDVLKAASWRSPAKHARGNIFNDDNGLGGITAYGARYLK